MVKLQNVAIVVAVDFQAVAGKTGGLDFCKAAVVVGVETVFCGAESVVIDVDGPMFHRVAGGAVEIGIFVFTFGVEKHNDAGYEADDAEENEDQ